MITIYCLEAIFDNLYFNFDPYLHQIITIVLSIILMHYEYYSVEQVIEVKEKAIKLITQIYTK